ncbi:MAG: Druantia anti-phage system protein DruA [Dokdonella sp.]|uniref:Druantia anti-phage system protein DruA n=1 Tax=Dokdonella sp. TaxID=2291710 RepID=UPI003F81A593
MDKEAYRRFHLPKRVEKLEANLRWLDRAQADLLKWFADGTDVVPSAIQPELELISKETWQSDLFRLAALYWQVPVSDGYGRRMRFLVWDRSNGKLMGIFALGDAVFNQAARDAHIGWDHHRRGDALVNLMDAYVLGSLPPYSHLLGGKLVASLVATRDVSEAFKKRYCGSTGLISGQKKNARLVAVTTTSALGRSSVYNRLKLGDRQIFEPIGFTSGWGHFHLSGKIFDELRAYLEFKNDSYANGFNVGSGPNWRIRVIRRALEGLGLDTSLARHGFSREVFFAKLASNAQAYLRGDNQRAMYRGLPSVKEVSAQAIERWMIPRSMRDRRYLDWKAVDLIAAVYGNSTRQSQLVLNEVRA